MTWNDGRGVTWNDDLNVGNPAAHRSVKEYHSLVQEEQTIARCFPSQAVPLFLDKLKLPCSHLRNLIVTPEMKCNAVESSYSETSNKDNFGHFVIHIMHQLNVS